MAGRAPVVPAMAEHADAGADADADARASRLGRSRDAGLWGDFMGRPIL